MKNPNDSVELDSPVDKPMSRAERKRRETRARIISAAEGLMRKQPIDEITIQDMTEAADVGHGTFYLHFKSKYEVLVPIIQQEAIKWDGVIQDSVISLGDPAEVMAFSARHMARIISADPLWRWFLRHSGVPVDDMREAIGRFSARDFGRGLMSGRFNVPEITVASSFMFGAFVSALLTSFDAEDPDKSIDQVVEMILRVIGLDAAEARAIAHQPLLPLGSV